MSEEEIDRLKKENEDLKSMVRNHEEIMKVSNNPIDELTSLRSQVSRVESMNEELLSLKKQVSEQASTIESLEKTLTQKEEELAKLKTSPNSGGDTESLKKTINDLKAELQNTKSNESITLLEYQNLKSSTKDWLQQINSSKQRIEELEVLQKEKDSAIKTLQNDIEDARTEKQIIHKRSVQDLKDLRDELAKEKIEHSRSKEKNEQLSTEVEQLLSTQRRHGNASTPVSKNDKIIMEHQSLRINELELENLNLRMKSEKANEELAIKNRMCENQVEEINKLQADMVTLGSQFNQMLRDKQS